MNYIRNKVQVSYLVELPQSNFPEYTNAPTFPWFWAFSPTFTDLCRIPWHFQVSRKVVTQSTADPLWNRSTRSRYRFTPKHRPSQTNGAVTTSQPHKVRRKFPQLIIRESLKLCDCRCQKNPQN